MNNINKQIFESVDILVEDKINNLPLNKIMKVTIVNCLDNLMEYTINLNGVSTIAYALSPTRIYQPGEIVYIAIVDSSKGDYSGTKLILGSIDSRYNKIGQ